MSGSTECMTYRDRQLAKADCIDEGYWSREVSHSES